MGTGAGESNPRGSSGAGHGGTGGRGKEDEDIGTFYGNVFYPTSFGSVGGGGKSPGGGVIKITTGVLQLDGNIESKGGVYKQGINHGGGSGGSIFINATTLMGEGMIDASGGAGNGYGGGGSGGRIAVYYDSSSFSGQFAAFGGSSLYEAGAAGTVYQKDYQKKLQYLWVSNKNQKPRTLLVNYANPRKDNARTWLPTLAKNNHYEFDEVSLSGGSHLVLQRATSDQKLVIGKLSDSTSTNVGNIITSYLHVGQWQTVNVLQTGFIFPVNIHVYGDGTLGLPSSIEVKNTAFNCEGYLSGLKELTVSDTTVNFGVNSGSFAKGLYMPTIFVFERVIVKAAGKIIFKNTEHGNVLETSRLEVKAEALVQARMLTIRSDTILVEEAAKISVDGQGFEQGVLNKNYGGKCLPVVHYGICKSVGHFVFIIFLY